MVPRWSRAPAGHWKQKLSGPDDKTALYLSFCNAIAIIGQLLGRLLEDQLRAGFLVSHFGVLNHLVRRGGGSTPLALARAFQAPKAIMTHTLSGLEKAGLIRFAPNPEDGRSKCVTLIEDGRRFRDMAIEKLKPELALMAERFHPGTIANAVNLLARMRDDLDRRRDEQTAVASAGSSVGK